VRRGASRRAGTRHCGAGRGSVQKRRVGSGRYRGLWAADRAPVDGADGRDASQLAPCQRVAAVLPPKGRDLPGGRHPARNPADHLT